MEKLKLQKEGLLMLLEGSLRSIPFNAVIAFLLSIELFYMHVPWSLILEWFLAVCFFTGGRFFFSRWAIRQDFYKKRLTATISIFLFLTFMMGAIWGSSYLIFLHYVKAVNEFVIILVLGGMAVGSIASLSIYLPAFYAYLLPILVPIIAYNFLLFERSRTVLATMFLFYSVVLVMSAKLHASLFSKIMDLSKTKELLIGKLRVNNKKLLKYNHILKEMSVTDALTGLYNRRYFDTALKNELARAKRNHHTLNLVLIDIDNFKALNDTSGHPYGDSFLKYFSKLLTNTLRRATDIIFRQGGDEFAVLVINVSLEETVKLCNKIMEQLQNERTKELDQQVTLSIGVVSVPPTSTELNRSAIINVADKALYMAKLQGKNQIISEKLKIHEHA
jgi:diguanylate cyclase (GGDEF)-like protein